MNNNLDSQKALVVFSGGQDSTTCLYWAFSKWGDENTKTISFDYGQRHSIELESAERICNLAGVEFDVIKTRNILRSVSPLVDSHVPMDLYNSVNEFEPGVQKTFVPGRNILFLTIAAVVVGGTSLLGGVGGYGLSVIGVLILQIITTVLVGWGLSWQGQQFILGLLIIPMVALYARSPHIRSQI